MQTREQCRIKRQQHRDFNVLWLGQTLSVFGSAVSLLALPSVAILTLHASPFQVGLLEALAFAPFPTLGLFVGVFADRTPRRRIMLIADLFRAIVLASIPLAAIVHALTYAQLAIVALLVGIGTVFFEISYQSYVPVLVAVAELPRSNARLEFTRSLAEIAGNGVAGLLISLLGAARAVGVDAFSFIVSVASLLLIRKREQPHPKNGATNASVLVDIREGLAFVFRSPVLRSIAACTATSNFGSAMIWAVLLVFAYRDLHLKAVTVGLIFAFANVGFLGAALSSKIAARLGLGRTLVVSILVAGSSRIILPLALEGMPVAVLFIAELFVALTTPIYNINQVSLRQTLVPPHLQGRMNATMRTFVWGTMPLGSLAGGTLGSTIGVVPTIVVGALVGASSFIWIAAGPAGRLRSISLDPT